MSKKVQYLNKQDVIRELKTIKNIVTNDDSSYIIGFNQAIEMAITVVNALNSISIDNIKQTRENNKRSKSLFKASSVTIGKKCNQT